MRRAAQAGEPVRRIVGKGAEERYPAWLATYAVHSTLILAGAWWVQRLLAPAHEQRELKWKMGMLGGLATATLAVATGLTPLGGRYESAAVVEATWSAALSATTPLRMLPILIVAAWMLYGAGLMTRVVYTTLHARRSLGPLGCRSAGRELPPADTVEGSRALHQRIARWEDAHQ